MKIPKGWPTEEMIDAGERVDPNDHASKGSWVQSVLEAALAAAPTPPAQEAEPVAWTGEGCGIITNETKKRMCDGKYSGDRAVSLMLAKRHDTPLYLHFSASYRLGQAARRALGWMLGGLCALEDDEAVLSVSDRLREEIANELMVALKGEHHPQSDELRQAAAYQSNKCANDIISAEQRQILITKWDEFNIPLYTHAPSDELRQAAEAVVDSHDMEDGHLEEAIERLNEVLENLSAAMEGK